MLILGGAHELLQTTYIDDAAYLTAVTIDEISGKIAVAGGSHLYIYEPQGKSEGLLRVRLEFSIWNVANPLFSGHELTTLQTILHLSASNAYLGVRAMKYLWPIRVFDFG